MRQALQEEVTPLPLEGKAERIARGKRDPLWFMQTYLPHYFTAPFAPFHKRWLKKLNTRGKHLFGWMMGRDSGKTVFAGLGYPIHQGLYGFRKFYLHISKNTDLASDNLEFIRLEFKENPRILQDFGDQIVAGADTSGDFMIKAGMRFKALGLRSTHRGWRSRQYRPDLIGADDLDDDERVESEKLIEKDIKRLLGGAYFMLDKNNGTMFLTGNKFSNRGILARIQEEHPKLDFTDIKALIKDRNGVEHSFWPELYSTEFLQKERETIGWITFNRERQNEPVEKSDFFQPEWFRGVSRSEIKVTKTIQYLDPAYGTTDSADFRSHTVLGLDEISGNVVVLDCVSNRAPLVDMVDDSYALHKEWNTIVCGMEDTLQKLLWRDYKDGAKRHGYVLPNRGIDNKANKDVRIQGVSGPIQLGQILFLGLKWEEGATQPTFENPHMKILYESLVYYPNFKKDPADSLAGGFKLLEIVGDTEAAYRSVRKRKIGIKRRKGSRR